MESQLIRNGDVDDLVNYFEKEGFVSHEEVDHIYLKFYNIEKEFVLRRSHGTSLYSTKDLAYHRYKVTLWDLSLDILGSDHKLSVNRLK